MTFRFKFAKLHNGRKAGSPPQVAAAVLVNQGKRFRLWSILATNRTGDVRVRDR